MNIKHFFSIALAAGTLATLPATFTSCDNDDTSNVDLTRWTSLKVSGNYKAQNIIGVQSLRTKLELGTMKDQQLLITPDGADHITIKLAEYALPINEASAPYSLVASKAFELKNIKTTLESNGDISISGAVKGNVSMKLVGRKGNANETDFREYEVSNGSVTGTMGKDRELSLTISFQPGSMPMPIVYTIRAKR
ncbi:hypothetical protein EII14_04905 [Alloprevotella sp. OH1205_COT-284]|uniref:hypothetical protein n=1 Tax=Alloprevotella sp. OH1205_COT-284 TaxID=2491043 RepID=UPI000F5FF57C|nr:hypothetical protein [Alloprevotella sp. OH1205_COT-284]RRD79857.1 hypothetical protein EII14_04905 [Alloprevotella sp. OH1205_COT-284]